MHRNRGYYRNSLKAWRDDLLKQRRSGLARLERMKNMSHQDACDQAMLLEINQGMIDLVESAQRAEASIRELMDEPETIPATAQLPR